MLLCLSKCDIDLTEGPLPSRLSLGAPLPKKRLDTEYLNRLSYIGIHSVWPEVK
ncbi:hypothetical protein Bpfe_025490, partial [Biomphalaria pfeifferi]